MPLATTLPAAIPDTILIHLAALFLTGAGGDLTAARAAAAQMLGAYQPETEDELRLAANIISFSLHGLQALAKAASPDLPLIWILCLRGSAVSLSRESAKTERRLTQIQKCRQRSIPAQPEDTQPGHQGRWPDLDPRLRTASARTASPPPEKSRRQDRHAGLLIQTHCRSQLICGHPLEITIAPTTNPHRKTGSTDLAPPA